MRAQAALRFFGLGLLALAGCCAPTGEASQASLGPPPWAEQDRTVYNSQQVGLFLTRNQGWQAWLNAVLASQRASDELVDASRYNTSTWAIIQSITAAQDAYKVATSFDLPPFTVTSSCRNLGPETTGFVQLSDGLIVRYSFLLTKTQYFDNGSSCVVSVGLVDEIDSSRGLPVAMADRDASIDWSVSFSRYLVWNQPYWRLSTGTTLSLPDIVRLIEK